MSAVCWIDVSLRKGSTMLLDRVSLTAAKGEVLGIVGPNGAGKTSLLRAAAGLEPGVSGRIEIGALELAGLPARRRARLLSYLPQQAEAAWPIAVEEAVALGRLPHLGAMRRVGEIDRRAVAAAMAEVGVAPLARRPLTSLSGGERALVLIARALAVGADLLLADEPTAALDPHHQLAAMELFRRLAQSGRTVCVALHDLSLAARFCDRLAVMMGGRIEMVGPPEAALDDTSLARVYAIRGRRARIDGQDLLIPWERLNRWAVGNGTGG
jgi:iron complex transport system ATP-binding protein